MSDHTLLPLTDGIRVDAIAPVGDAIQVRLTVTKPYAPCPLCHQLSGRVHSHYQRSLTDLPWGTVAVRISVGARRFFCDTLGCPRRIFAEPLPGLADRYAHKTQRLAAAIYLIGYALGGEAGAREAHGLGVSVSPDTLLRRVRQVAARVAMSQDRLCAVGVDDFAFRKRHRYGTLLVDLERHRLLDLLPDRTAQSLSTWLKAHPDIEVVSRDRGGAYADGAREGAPQALQVADRFHLLQNLSDAMQRLLTHHHKELRKAAECLSCSHSVDNSLEHAIPVEQPAPQPMRPLTSQRLESEQRRQRRIDVYEEVHRRHNQGQSQREIARQMGLARATVGRCLRTPDFADRAQPRSLSKPLVAYLPYLTQRWEQGCHNIAQLHREIQEQGYSGGYLTVFRHLTGQQSPVPDRPVEVKPVVFAAPSAKSTVWLLLKDEGRTPQEEAFIQALLSHSPAIKQAQMLAKEFLAMVRQRNAEALKGWMERVNQSGLSELRGFVGGLKRDLAAVEAGLSQRWSNGQVEGQVNRLKLIKRSMYGRARFDLLKARVMPMVQTV